LIGDVRLEVARFGHGDLRLSTKILVGLVAASGVGLTVTILLWDFFSSDSSSTAVLIIPFMVLYTGAAVAVVVLAEATVRAAIRALRRGRFSSSR